MEKVHYKKQPEIWGGIECSINRVANEFYDQCGYSGHYNRPDDIDQVAKLGISKMRYPVLWEKHFPKPDSIPDWDFAAKNIKKLQASQVEPILGLVHHGSGPDYINFFDDSFAEGLASYAKKVAQRFPEIIYYTPVNEPLTTARFCGLYGLWYPHGMTDKEFLSVLLSQCKATVLAMKAIREVNPGAKLIQTEDLGKTHSTPLLKYQADFENERRWLAIDILCGKVDRSHKLWTYIKKAGIPEGDLSFFIQNPCLPDILGFNYYVTSERYIDETLEMYPAHTQGGNKKHRYADVEALRVASVKTDGLYKLMKQAWERFDLPLAITEVHLGCTREEQLRWLKSVWDSANQLYRDHVDIRAVTVWSVLGGYNWCNLLTSDTGDYETGVFDVRSGYLRPTALAGFIRSLSEDKPFEHPVMEIEGWWERDIRILYTNEFTKKDTVLKASKPVLIIGKTGTLGNALAKICENRGIYYHLLSRHDVDICDPAGIERIIDALKPWAIINAAGFVRVDDAEADAERCFQANAIGPENLAKACAKSNISFLTFSSDLVFDGSKSNTYVEKDGVSPLNVYGESKAMAEDLVLAAYPDALIIRTSAFFGPWDKYNFVYSALNAFKNTQAFSTASNIFISPTYIPDLVNNCLDLLLDNASGVWHVANAGETSWSDLASEIALRGGFNGRLVNPVPYEDLNWTAKRPKFSALTSEKGIILPSLCSALNRYFNEQEILTI